jgi:hypothetical protein
MTEAEWRACGDPKAMLRFVRDRASGRKLRLFAAECWRRRCRDMRSLADVRRAVDKAERLADGAYTLQKGDGDWLLLQRNPFHLATQTSNIVATLHGKGLVSREEQVALLRDVFEPFFPGPIEPAWRTAEVVRLAEGIYEERAYERMPILADALLDAGCADERLLDHCRGEGPHLRGCWVVDLFLGKE